MNTPSDIDLDALFRVTLPPRPYPGIRPFEKTEWPIFFGRERMADALTGQLIRSRLLVVHGDSGCGKSSLVRAGVLPRLEQENARGGIRWRTCTALPREAPLWNLAEALAGLEASPPPEERVMAFRRLLNLGRDAPTALAKQLRRDHDDQICLLIDQFEELFDHAVRHGPHEAQLLIDLLVGLHANPPEGLYVVITMRSEFLGACARFRGFAEAVTATQCLLPRMNHPELLRAIREPATLYHGTVSRALAERLIADTSGGQDELPLIQHGLLLLHRERMVALGRNEAPTDAAQPDVDTSWHLGLEHYRNADGLVGLLSDHADAVMHEVTKTYEGHGDSERATEALFRALTDISADGQAIRRPRTLAQLVTVTGADEAGLRKIIDRFRADGTSFLKPYGSEPLGRAELIDITHEALIRCWRRITEPANGWLAREFNDGLIWRALLVQAEEFERNPDNVLSPATTDERESWLLQHTPAWAERYGGGWDRVQRLLTASAEARDRQRAEQAAAVHRERQLQVRLYGLVFLVLLLGVSIPLGYVALQESHEAQVQFESAQSARARSVYLTQEIQQSTEVLGEVVRELEHVVPVTESGSDLTYRLAELRAQTTNLSNAVTRPTTSSGTITEAMVPIEATNVSVAHWIYIHIADEAQRLPALDFQRRLAESRLDNDTVIVPGIEWVKASPPRSVLRCFRTAECQADGTRLTNLINDHILLTPPIVLEDLSVRYGESLGGRSRHYELWFAQGADIRLQPD